MNEKRILLVDDEQDIVKILSKLLQAHHYQVEVAVTGLEALEKVKQNPDLIILDLTLPDIDGLEVCQKVKGNKQLRDIPIIILSARGLPTDKVDGLQLGADDYLTKPFDNDELLARIEAVLRRSLFTRQTQKELEDLKVELSRILQNGLITSFFQPIFSRESLKPLGLEVRSRPPVQSPLSSSQLLFRAALGLGMYTELETLCWKKAITRWKDSLNEGKLFLNCVPCFIEKKQLDQMFFSMSGISPQDTTLEITESSTIEDHALFSERLHDLKSLGTKIAINDVGSGSASLEIVSKVQPDFVKIDMTLIRHIHQDSLKQNFVKSIVTFCKEKEIETIAEGIEETDEFDLLSELGVDAVQGNLFARAMPEISLDLFSKYEETGGFHEKDITH